MDAHALAAELRLDPADVQPARTADRSRNETAAATPAPWPLTVQHIMLRTDACEILSPPIERPATIRLPTPFGTSDRYGTWK